MTEQLPNDTSTAEAEREQRIRAALQQLADLNAFADIADPGKWQRRIRKDRHLLSKDA